MHYHRLQGAPSHASSVVLPPFVIRIMPASPRFLPSYIGVQHSTYRGKYPDPRRHCVLSPRLFLPFDKRDILGISPYPDKQEFAEEHVLWQKIYNDLMINVSPGQLFGCDRPGWFRMCYAFEEDTVKEAVRRLATLKK